MKRGYGYRKGPPPRALTVPSYQAAHAARAIGDTTPPPAASIEDLVLDVLDQGQLGSCVLNAMGQAVRCCQVRGGISKPFVPSRLDSYAFARLRDGSPLDADTGTFLHTAAEVYQSLGFAPERQPYSDSPDAWSRKPSAEYERDAYDQANRTETSIHAIVGTDDARWEAVQRAIAGRFPVVWAGDVSVAFAQGAFDPTRPLDPPMPADIDGGHAMMLAGYSDAGARILNSWSSGWGDAGYFLASRAFVLSASELFVVEHVVTEGVIS